MAVRQLSAGEILFREGEAATCAYTIQTGNIEILKATPNGEIRIGEFVDGDMLAEMALFDGAPPYAHTARALSDTVVDSISGTEVVELLGQSPSRLVPAVMSVFKRLSATLRAPAAAAPVAPAPKPEVEPVHGEDVAKVIIAPDSEAVSASVKNTVEMPVAHLPLRIGGYDKHQEQSVDRKGMHVSIASDGPPLTVSVQHCEVIQYEGSLYVLDLGSRFGTTVNGISIGRGKGFYKAPLQQGENTVILGDKKTSPYKVKITCS